MTSEMRILTLWQPWASLIAMGLKGYETRSWGTPYRGKLAIHAAKRKPDAMTVTELSDDFQEIRKAIWHINYIDKYRKVETDLLPLGCIVGITDLTDCEQILPSVIHSKSALEKAVGDWRFYRYAWKLDNVQQLTEPLPYKGGQGLRPLEDTATLYAIAARLP